MVSEENEDILLYKNILDKKYTMELEFWSPWISSFKCPFYTTFQHVKHRKGHLILLHSST
jgi:hypothetical protein